MTDTKNTPTPWKYSERQDGTCEVYDDSGELIMSDEEFYPACPNSDDIQHIVKCVNMHDELVEAIKNLISSGFFGSSGANDRAIETLKKAGAL